MTTSDTTFIIMAGGKSTRWTGAVPKQLVVIDGETLLERTIRILREQGATNIHVTVSPALREYMEENGIRLTCPAHIFSTNTQEIDRFLSCSPIWGEDTCFLYGDTFYTTEAIQKIMAQFIPPTTFYGRKSGNKNKRYGEMFALRVRYPREGFVTELERLREKEKQGEIRGLGWDVYRAYRKQRFVELDPKCEDFDKLEDYETFIAHHEHIQE
jgi:molybdopterin-guanine dinucleotide biosynthesis protein A